MTVGDEDDDDHYLLINDGKTGSSNSPSARARYFMFLLNLTNVIPIINAIVYWNECPAIPSLQWFLIVFGCFGVANAFVKFHFRIPADPRKQSKDCVTNCSNLLGVGQLLVSIWGAAISWSQIPDIDDINCNSTLFNFGVIASAICCFILLIVIIFIIVECVKGCRNRG